MKVYDIISEEKEQLNEFVPLLIGGLTIGGILTAINIGMSAWGAYDIYKFIEKYNDDPEKITDDEWGELFIDAALLFAPVLGKIGRAGFVRLLPKSWIVKGGAWFKEAMLKLYAKAATTGLAGADRIKVLKAIAKESRTAAATANKTVKELGTAWKVLQTIGVSYEAYDFYTKQAALEEQYAKFKAGNKTTKIFGSSTDTDAEEIYLNTRRQLLGELTVAIGGIVGGWAVGKTVSFMGAIVGKTPIIGKGLQMSSEMIAGVARMMGNTSVYIPLFMATDAGKKFLETGVLHTILQTIGGTEQVLLNLLGKALKEAGLTKIANAISTSEPPNSVKAKDAETEKYIKTGQGDPEFRKQTVGKKVYIGGVQVTDDDGYQLPNFENHFKDLQDKAKIAGEPDPTAGIPKKPGVNYNTGF
jgi:hypothetical protein